MCALNRSIVCSLHNMTLQIAHLNQLIIQINQSILFPVNTIAVAKPEKAKMVESMLVQMARSGQLQGKVGHQCIDQLMAIIHIRPQKIDCPYVSQTKFCLKNLTEIFIFFCLICLISSNNRLH